MKWTQAQYDRIQQPMILRDRSCWTNCRRRFVRTNHCW